MMWIFAIDTDTICKGKSSAYKGKIGSYKGNRIIRSCKGKSIVSMTCWIRAGVMMLIDEIAYDTNRKGKSSTCRKKSIISSYKG